MQIARSRSSEARIVLGELHHRFMNSLQIMTSLATVRPNHDPLGQLERLRDCIAALGRLHCLLAARDTPTVALGCEEICSALAAAFGRQATWTIAVEAEPVEDALRLDLLLLLTELMTNALKHAGIEAPAITIALTRQVESWHLEVVSSTTGRAASPRIARELTMWLGGELSVSCENGFSVCAAIPDPVGLNGAKAVCLV